MKRDPTNEMMKIDPALLEVWSELTLKQLLEKRDELFYKRNILSKESSQYIKQLDGVLQDLEAYINIRQERENPNSGNNILA